MLVNYRRFKQNCSERCISYTQPTRQEGVETVRVQSSRPAQQANLGSMVKAADGVELDVDVVGVVDATHNHVVCEGDTKEG
jgi:hypothetical protein